jgi:hypothetical protein
VICVPTRCSHALVGRRPGVSQPVTATVAHPFAISDPIASKGFDPYTMPAESYVE